MNKRPSKQFIRISIPIVLVLLYVFIVITVSLKPRHTVEDTAERVPATEQSILAGVNAERAKVGVAPLVLHPNITKSAQLKADDMLNRGYREHFLPEDPKATLTSEMYSYVEPVCSASSENIMAGYDTLVNTTDSSMYAWMNSEPHRNAILNPDYTYTGIASSSDNTILVQHFCVARTNQ